MTFQPCQVTGTLVAPDGAAMPEVQVQFLPAPVTMRGAGGDILVPHPVQAVTDPDARLEVALAPGVYTVRARAAQGREYPPFLVDVPATPEAALADILLHLPAPQSVYDAVASARVSSKAAAEAALSAGAASTAGASAEAAQIAAAAAQASAEGLETLVGAAQSGATQAEAAMAAAQASAQDATTAFGQATDAALAAQSSAQTAGAGATQAGLSAGAAGQAAVAAAAAAELAKASNVTFATRAAFEATAVPGDLECWSVQHSGLMLHYVRDPDGTAIASANGVKGAPLGVVCPEHWSANVTPGTTDMAPAIQAAVDWVRARRNGGVVQLRPTTYGIGSTVRVWERVTLQGEGGIPRNWWQTPDFAFAGTVLRALPGLNSDVIEVLLSGTEVNTDRRHGGGVRRLYVDGNRTANSTGSGLVLTGVNVPVVRDVIVGRCAGDGVRSRSSGQADGQCNNMNLNRIISFSNAGNGFAMSGGDSQISELWGINNGINGMTASNGSTIFRGCYFNNNSQHGFYSSGNDCDFVGVTCYHNARNGVLIDGPRASLVGVKARHNGTDTTTFPNNRCGIVLTSAAENFLVDGCAAYDEGFKDDITNKTQQKGFRILANTGVWGSNSAFDNVQAQFEFTNPSAIGLHAGASSGMSHPGFVATGNIDLAQSHLLQARSVTFRTPTTATSAAGGVLNLSNSSTVSLNIAGGATITAINGGFSGGLGLAFLRNTNTAPVTFAAGASLRTKSGGDLVLEQNRAVTFKEFATGAWFEV